MSFTDDMTADGAPAFVDVELVYETKNNVHKGPWCAIQVFTKNRVYHVDWSMECFEVVDKKTGQRDENNRLIGATLTGGRRVGSKMEVTFPLPRPGVSAVFEVGGEGDFITTSEVTKVVLRLRVFEVGHDDDWKEMSQRFKAALTTRRGH